MGAVQQRDDFPVTGGGHDAAGGIDGEAVTQQASGKHRIGYLIERRAPAVERRNDLERGPSFSISTQSRAHSGSSRGRANRKQTSWRPESGGSFRAGSSVMPFLSAAGASGRPPTFGASE